QSLSPTLFGVDPTITYLRLAAMTPAHGLAFARDLGLSGINVTAPFKTIVELTDAVDPSAAVVRAANTVIFRSDGKSVAYNTDSAGVSYVLSRAQVRAGQRGVILGAGGAARAAEAALTAAGVEVVVAARQPAKAHWFSGPVVPLNADCLTGATIVIDCLSTAQRVLPRAVWHPSMTVLVARYSATAHRDDALAAGCQVLDGRDWLIGQAAAAAQHFTGQAIDPELMAAQLASPSMRSPRHLVLIGGMGSGKTTTSQILGELMGLPVIDLDEFIEKDAGMTIPELFAAEGESGFRQREAHALSVALAGPTCVIATGGGTLTTPGAADAIRSHATVIWLWCPPESAAQRITGSTRPLLHRTDPTVQLHELLAQRRDAYERASDLVVDTGRFSSQQVAQRIAAEYPLRTLAAPGSKSVTQRALLLAATATAPTLIYGANQGADVAACCRLVQALGAQVDREGTTLHITPRAKLRAAEADVGESGTALRLGAAVAALQAEPFTLTTTGTLRHRPQQFLLDALHSVGVTTTSVPGAITVSGPLRAGDSELTGAQSSQPMSGLALALAQVDGASQLHLSEPVSLGYLQLTAAVARDFGLTITVAPDGRELIMPGGERPARTEPYYVEGDWSAGAFLLVAGALGAGVRVTGLERSSAQADVAVLDVLRQAGVMVTHEPGAIVVQPSRVTNFTCDATHCPDLVPPLAVLATAGQGMSVIWGARRLRIKESDRGAVLCEQLGRLGARLELDDDALRIWGGPLHGGMIDPHQDHRIAMAGAVAALRADGPVHLTDHACVAKSYPDFFADLERITHE
ncbi:MAG: 3-phosphoshikimate 1-carboxyvinyltransferase, partial [Propionibacteriaceae bacterium]